jgi:hypothetical protein
MTLKSRWQAPVLLALVTGLFWLLLDAEEVRQAVREGLELCVRSAIPSLFPFLVVSALLMSLGFGEWVARPLSGLMRLYHIGGAGASALILGLVGGYPVGARTAASLVRDGLLSREEGERLLTFCNNSNPAFLITVLGLGVFGSTRVGLWLWLIHLLSALLAGLLVGRRPRGGPLSRRQPVPPPPFRAARFSTAFVNAVQSALGAMASICAFVVFFYVLALPLRQVEGPLGTALAGALELFSATPRITADPTGFLLAAGLAGWGGLSVHCQTLAVLGDSGLSPLPCVAGKAVQGLLSLLLAALLCPYVLG